jgi:hypothetical protein
MNGVRSRGPCRCQRWARRRSSSVWCAGSVNVSPARERPLVPARQLAGVQHRCGHVCLGEAQLDATAGEAGATSSRCVLSGDTAAASPETTRRRCVSGSGRIRSRSSISRSAGTARIV